MIEDFDEIVKLSHFVSINKMVLKTNNGELLKLDLDKLGKAEFQYKFLKSFINGIVSRNNIFYSELDKVSKNSIMKEYTDITTRLENDKQVLGKKMNKLMELNLTLINSSIEY